MIKGGNAEKLLETKLKKILKSSKDILDIGTSQRYAKELKKYEYLFKEKNYLAAGFEPEMKYGKYNCDMHADICNMIYEDESFDAIICLEVLEHVADPFAAAREIRRVLRPGGILLLSTPFMLGYHGKTKEIDSPKKYAHSSYPDLWRFTHEGLYSLFKDFSTCDVYPIDGPIETGLKVFRFSRLFEKSKLARKIIDFLDRPKVGSQSSRHFIYAIK